VFAGVAGVAGVVLAAAWLGCASAPKALEPEASPAPAPSAASAPSAPSATASSEDVGKAAPAAPAGDGAVSAPVKDDSVVVVDPGGDEDGPQSLVEAARAERARRAQAAPPAISVTDKNLAEYAQKGQITFAEGTAAASAPQPQPEGEAAVSAGVDGVPGVAASADEPSATEKLLNSEDYWRQGALERRLRWRLADDEIKRLEQSAAELRQRFYLESDVYRRDTQIKPEWDRVLDRLQRLREEAEQAQQDLAEFLDQGNRAGALPGWLREGIDEEPAAAKPKKGIVPHQSIEPPPAAEPPPRGGR
jgi:hypothetical protein